MKLNEQLDQALRDLRSEYRQRRRPPLEIGKMRTALHLNSRPAKRRRVLISFPVAAACIALLLAYLHPFRRGRAPQPEAAPPSAFLLLPSSAVLPPPSNTTYVCVRLHKEDLRQFGVDIPEVDAKQIVQAEFALGDDGLARAVRLIGPFSGSGNQPANVSSR
jgi:hypothetical protein